jgi:hypothetical protein
MDREHHHSWWENRCGMPERPDRRPSRNSSCPCGSGEKWKHCHGGPEPPPRIEANKRLALDPMASLLEDVVGPRLLDLRNEAAWAWSSTLHAWVVSEGNVSGHDTERLERLVQRAWNACVQALRSLDSRFGSSGGSIRSTEHG